MVDGTLSARNPGHAEAYGAGAGQRMGAHQMYDTRVRFTGWLRTRVIATHIGFAIHLHLHRGARARGEGLNEFVHFLHIFNYSLHSHPKAKT